MNDWLQRINDLLQRIAVICKAISSLKVYTTVVHNWLNRVSGKTGKIITQKGTESLPYYSLDKPVGKEVFYPKPFKDTPHLTIRFSERSGPRGQFVDVGLRARPAYRITEQRPGGFRVLIYLAPGYEPIFEWEAKGVLRD